ncbi:hypothetical protein WICPIJ_000796 [Wickerhamomyces pijperi]|uniref:Uncharacterized protein n=1 Tax=Wickerhamomyces pijperi TaxID=599730 RepID=A0A9P8QFC7_WICPI|nr:hypothetical protein WICPIJ_000796 [Wickerhamomyces pijperi]
MSLLKMASATCGACKRLISNNLVCKWPWLAESSFKASIKKEVPCWMKFWEKKMSATFSMSNGSPLLEDNKLMANSEALSGLDLNKLEINMLKFGW